MIMIFDSLPGVMHLFLDLSSVGQDGCLAAVTHSNMLHEEFHRVSRSLIS